MNGLVEVIAKALVANPDEVNVTSEEVGEETIIKLRVAKDDMGKVIGKQGRVAKAMRTIVKSAAMKESKRVQVEIVEE